MLKNGSYSAWFRTQRGEGTGTNEFVGAQIAELRAAGSCRHPVPPRMRWRTAPACGRRRRVQAKWLGATNFIGPLKIEGTIAGHALNTPVQR